MPLVQSLDILRRASPTRCSKSCSTTCTSGCERAARCRKRSRRTGHVPGRLHGVAARREKSGNLEQVLRRYVSVREGRLGGPRARRSRRSSIRRSCSCCRSSSSAMIVVKVVPEFGNFYDQFGKELPLSTRFIVGVSTFARTSSAAGARRHRRRRRVLGVAEAAGRSASGSIAVDARMPMLGGDRAEVLDVAGGADAGDAARRRHSRW